MNDRSTSTPAPTLAPRHKRSGRILLGLAIALCALFWGKLIVLGITTTSPPRSVTWESPDGTALELEDPSDIGCHGTVLVDGARLWQFCRDWNSKSESIARFDLARGAAVQYRTGGLRGIHGVVGRMPGGDLAIWSFDGQFRLTAKDGLRPLGNGAPDGHLFMPAGVGVREGVVELVDGYEPTIRTMAPDGTSTTRPRAVPAADGADARLERAVLRDGAWELVYALVPRDFRADRTTLELVIGGEKGPFRSLGEVPLLTDVEPEYRASTARSDTLIDGNEGGRLPASLAHPFPVALRPDGTLDRRDPPPGVSIRIYELDFEVTDHGVSPIAVSDRHIFFRGAWWSLTAEDELRLVAPDGKTGGPLVDDYWLDPGLKFLPDGGDGYWVMGSLGKSYLHVDAALNRDDGLSLAERIGRLFERDRSKRNSDFFQRSDPLLTLARKASVPIVLFCLPAGLAVLALVRRLRRRGTRTAPDGPRGGTAIVAVACLALMLAFAPWAWQLLGYF